MSSRPYRPDDTVVFPTLDDSELAALDTLGTRLLVTVSEYLHREGDATYDFYVILSGAVEIVVRSEMAFIGADPAAGWLSGRAALDEQGFVLTDRSLGEAHLDERWNALGRQPLPFETSHPGLFAVGDVRSGSTKRVAAAVGEGSAAVRSVHEYLAFAH